MLKVWTAFSRIGDAANAVADALLNLSKTFNEADAHARRRLGLDEPEVPALEVSEKKPRRAG